MKRIIIWGIGRRTDFMMKFHYFDNCEIIGFADTYSKEKMYLGYKVLSNEELCEIKDNYDYLIIATQYFCDVYEKCMDMGIDHTKIILTDYVEETPMKQNLSIIKEISPKLYENIRFRKFRLINENEKDDFDLNHLVGNGRYAAVDYMKDYFRYRTFEFIADEIIEQNIAGNVAELGVFRGLFSALINNKFPQKELYLFDTFNGFNEAEEKTEALKGRSNEEFKYIHTKTSEEIVITNLPYPEKCHICKGFFPQTVTKEIERINFAFVSIDVDFEDSIYEGIKFFYPRLSDGGVIYLHDYNSQMLRGVKEAVLRYECENGLKLKKVPLADRAGTLVILK